MAVNELSYLFHHVLFFSIIMKYYLTSFTMKPSCTILHNKKMKIMKVPYEQLNLQYYNIIIFV